MSARPAMAWRRVAAALALAAAAVLGASLAGAPAQAQSQGGSLADMLGEGGNIPLDPRGSLLPGQGTDQQLQIGGSKADKPSRPRAVVPRGPAPPSRLERLYSQRADRELRLQGYGALSGRPLEAAGSAGGVQDDYVLKVGDRLRVSFYGQQQKTHNVVVDPAGKIAVPPFGPISAAGRRLGELRQQIEAETDQAFLETDSYVALVNIDRASVTVSGHVRAPGGRNVPALSDLANALRAAGGVARTGSLRRIKLRRQGEVQAVDLYPALLTGAKGEVPTVRPGDKIVVPALGPTVAVAGFVQRDGIYELPPGKKRIPASRALDWAGGRLAPQKLRAVVLRFGKDGDERSFTVSDLGETELRDGDILIVQRRDDIRRETVTVVGGGDAVSGVYPLSEAATVAEAIGNPARLPADTYRPLAVIERRSRATGARSFEAVDLAAVLAGEATAELNAHDRLILLDRRHIDFLNAEGVRRALDPQRPFRPVRRLQGSRIPAESERIQAREETGQPRRQAAASGQSQETASPAAGEGDATSPLASGNRSMGPRCAGLFAVARLQESKATRLAESAVIQALAGVAPGPPESCPDLFAEHSGLLVYLLERSIVVTGPVNEPGLYPFGSAPTRERVLRVAGGLLAGAERSTLTRVVTGQRAGAEAGSFDAGRIWALRAADVRVTGAVAQPGRRQIGGQASLSDIFAERGDLGPNAYPFFAVVERRGRRGFARQTLVFSPAAVLAGKADLALADGDRIRIFRRDSLYFDVDTRKAVQQLLTAGEGTSSRGQNGGDGAGLNQGASGSGTTGENDGSGAAAQAARAALANQGANASGSAAEAARRALAKQRGSGTTEPGSGGSVSAGARSDTGGETPARARLDPGLRAAVQTHLVGLHGAVAAPGFYPVADRVSVAALFDALPGPTAEADLSRAEYTNLTRTGDGRREAGSRRRVDLSRKQARQALYLAPGENLRVPARFSDQLEATARITGEVKQPGTYRLLRGDRLLDLIERAGGLTEQAYIPGAVFLRESVREQRRKAFREASRELQRELAGLAARGGSAASAANLQAARQLAQDLAQADVQGRMVIEGDPQALRTSQAKNLLLQGGDRLHYPSRPSHVTVSGQVLSPSALQYRPGRSPISYLRAAGGTTDFADEDRIFVVQPSGRARVLEANVFTYDPPKIKPGTRIIVPREVAPLSLRRLTSSIAGIARDLSTTATTQQQLTQ